MSREQRGSAVLETLVLGLLVVLLLGQLLITASRLQAAGELVTEVAQTAALEAARHGDEEQAIRMVQAVPGDLQVVAHRVDDEIRVEVSAKVGVVGPTGVVSQSVTGRAAARVSPYRSNRDRAR